MNLFVDASTFYAAVDKGDSGHLPARRTLGMGDRLITTDHVLAETWSLLHHKLGWHVAEGFWAGIRSGVATIELVGAADLEVAWSIGEAFRDQDFSFVDRTSFAVMERLGVHRVASFDRDFAIYRFGTRRDRAFEIVR
jgi:predicted nucleic acid-binding protein